MTVRVDRDVKAQAEYVASKKRITLAEYLTGILRPVVSRDFDRAIKGD